MNIYAPSGSKVVYAYPENGYPSDQEKASKYLKIGETYTVKNVDVYDWRSRVTLVEVPEQYFNTVLFEDA
jgi:hypothetical protein